MRPPQPKHPPGPSRPGPTHSLDHIAVVVGLLGVVPILLLGALTAPVPTALLLAGGMVSRQLRRVIRSHRGPSDSRVEQRSVTNKPDACIED